MGGEVLFWLVKGPTLAPSYIIRFLFFFFFSFFPFPPPPLPSFFQMGRREETTQSLGGLGINLSSRLFLVPVFFFLFFLPTKLFNIDHPAHTLRQRHIWLLLGLLYSSFLLASFYKSVGHPPPSPPPNPWSKLASKVLLLSAPSYPEHLPIQFILSSYYISSP